MKTLVISFAIAVASAAGFAQCQTSRLSLTQELHDATGTIVATVDAATPAPESDSHLDGVDYTVRIDRVIKGKLASTDLHIFSENSASKFPMQIGKQYLLFVHRSDNTYQVDNCGNSGLLAASTITSEASLRQYATK